MCRSTIGILASLAIAVAADLAPALELHPNGKFDTGIETWGACCGGTGSVGFDATRDAGGSSHSGSAVLSHTSVVGGTPTYLFVARCLSGPAVQPGQSLFVGAKVRFREGESASGTAFLSVEFRPDAACQEASVGGLADVVETSGVARGTWLPLRIGSPKAGFVVPPGVYGVRTFVVIGKSAGPVLTLNVDDAFAAPVGTPVCDGFPATLAGTTDPDLLSGTPASDVIVGLGGADWIDGKGGNDRVCGGRGGDAISGGAGDDRIFGEGGADTLHGGADDDLLNGGPGKDEIHGGDGVDSMKGGPGFDECDGGPGAVDLAKSCESVIAVP